MLQRLGKFRINRELIQKTPIAKLAPIFSRVVVVSCELRYDMDAFEYVALSNDFDEVEPGMVAPMYDLDCKHVNRDGEEWIEPKFTPSRFQ
jgi:hypothetical protein